MPRPKATWYRPQDDPQACYTLHGRTDTTTTKRSMRWRAVSCGMWVVRRGHVDQMYAHSWAKTDLQVLLPGSLA